MNAKHRIGLRVRTIRLERGLTQEELAEMIERSVDALSNLERGISLPSFETLEKLAGALQLSLAELLDLKTVTSGGRRAILAEQLSDLGRQLGDDDLEIAVEQVRVLVARRGKSRRNHRRADQGSSG